MRFLDTNVLVYAFSTDDRGDAATNLLAEGGVIAIQSLNEFTDVARRKLCMSWDDIGAAVNQLLVTCHLFEPVTAQVHANGRAIAERYGIRIFDAMLLATALEAGCDMFLSEDLQNGMVIDATLTVRNPFAV